MPTHDHPTADGRIRSGVTMANVCQFSMRLAIIFVGVISITLGIVFGAPSYVTVAIDMVSLLAIPAVLTTIIVFGRAPARAFAIGALFPQAVRLYSFIANDMFLGFAVFFPAYGEPGITRMTQGPVLVMILSWVMSIVLGCVCVGVRRILAKP